MSTGSVQKINGEMKIKGRNVNRYNIVHDMSAAIKTWSTSMRIKKKSTAVSACVSHKIESILFSIWRKGKCNSNEIKNCMMAEALHDDKRSQRDNSNLMVGNLIENIFLSCFALYIVLARARVCVLLFFISCFFSFYLHFLFYHLFLFFLNVGGELQEYRLCTKEISIVDARHNLQWISDGECLQSSTLSFYFSGRIDCPVHLPQFPSAFPRPFPRQQQSGFSS